MDPPPEFLRSVVDGTFEAAFIILSNGLIWHMNEPSRQMFHVKTDDKSSFPTHVSAFISFCNNSSATDRHTSNITWNDVTAGELSTTHRWTTLGFGTPSSGQNNIPLTINIVRVEISDKKPEDCNCDCDKCYYFLYMKDDIDRERDVNHHHQKQIGIVDASEKTASLAAVESSKYMNVILDASFDALFVINDHGIIQKVNAASSKVFGWTMEELIGQNINIIMPEEHARKHDSYLENYASTGIKKMIGTQREVESRKKDGTLFPCILGLSELGWDGDGHKHYAGFIRDVTLQKSLLIAEAEREASDNLLHNILPKHIAQRLKKDPTNIADHFDNTTILFADIVGFTDRTSTMSPREIVTMLNDLFSSFDMLVETYDLNKVKTIGDCYMVTSIPSSELEHDGCARVCHFALDLMKAVRTYNCNTSQHEQIELRVGIATGQVVAGVLGSKRYLFDMWGDAVNTAARMEQHGLPGQIQVTKEVVQQAGRGFHFECRGQLAVKGKGAMETFLLKHAKDSDKRRSMYQPMMPITTPVVRSSSDGGVYATQDSFF